MPSSRFGIGPQNMRRSAFLPGSTRPGRHDRRGVTLVELIVIGFLLAIVVAIAIPGINPVMVNLRLRGAAWQVAGDLRLARQRAVTLKKRFRVCVTNCAIAVPAGSYSLERDEGTPGNPDWVSDTGVATRLARDVIIRSSATPTFNEIGAAGPGTVTLTNSVGTYQVAIAQSGRVTVCAGTCLP
jgi:Tfp pilus assembly protein FimT